MNASLSTFSRCVVRLQQVIAIMYNALLLLLLNVFCCSTLLVLRRVHVCLMGRLHGAILATTVGAIVTPTWSPVAFTRGDCRGDDRPM